jgi:hypothetical protein
VTDKLPWEDEIWWQAWHDAVLMPGLPLEACREGHQALELANTPGCWNEAQQKLRDWKEKWKGYFA